MKRIFAFLSVSIGQQMIMAIVLLLLVVGYALHSSRNCLGSQVAESARPATVMSGDEGTIFLLEADRSKKGLVDRTGRFKPTVSGATIMDDEQVGPCVRFGIGAGNGITVDDGGKITFDGGFTLEALVYFEDAVTSGLDGVLATKHGSFALTLKDGKLNNAWMAFPKEKIFIDSAKQYKDYPVDNQTFFGSMPIPSNRWVHLAVTYDQDMKVIRTWIDGGVDRTRYVTLEGDAPLLSDPTKSIDFVKGMKNVRVAGIKLSKGLRPIGATPALDAYVHQLPYASKIAITIDHIDRKLPLPIDVAILLEDPGGSSKVVKNVSLNSAESRDVVMDAPSWKGALHTVTIKAYSRNQMIFSRAVRISNPDPGNRIRINKDKSLSVSGKKIFPLLIYHAFPEDYRLLADMGFNIIMPRGLGLKWMGTGGRDAKTMADLKTCLDEAMKQQVYLIVEGNSVFGNLNRVPLFKDHPALLAWSGFDEPWGTLERFQESYNTIKLLDPDRPIYGTQNNVSRYSETAEGIDIIAPDSYPVPNTSLRDVAYRTSAASMAVAGKKPVWTILGQYGNGKPSLQELRCMAYLAIISGANGLGIYAWDDRKDKKTGWYTKEHPEDEKVLRAVIQELKGLENILLLPNSDRKTSFSPRNSALHAAIKEAGGKKYLFVASDSRREEEGILSVEGISEAVGTSLSSGTVRSSIRIKEGTLSLKLLPLEAVLYEIKG